MTAYGLGASAAPRSVVYGSEWRGLDRVESQAESSIPSFSPVAPSEEQWSNWFVKLSQFIPGEIVAGYVAVSVWFTSGSISMWVVIGVFTLLAAWLVYTGFCRQAAKVSATVSVKTIPWFRVIAAPLAFVCWVIALPGSPFGGLTDEPALKSAVLVIGTIALASFDELLSKSER